MKAARAPTDPRTVRLWGASAAIALGGVGAERWGAPVAWCALAGAVVLWVASVASAGRAKRAGRAQRAGRARPVAVACLVLAAGATIVSLRAAALDRAQIADVHRASAHLIVEVLDDPAPRGHALRALVRVIGAAGEGERPMRVRGARAILVIDPIPDRWPRATDRIIVEASLREERASWARRKGIIVRAYAKAYTPAGRSPRIVRRAAEIVRAGVRSAASHIPGSGRGMLEGFLIGGVSRLDPVITEHFRITGLSHLTAVSGSNVALVLALVGAIVRGLRGGARTTLVVLGLTVVVFAAASRFEPSVIRAGVMAGLALGARAFGARTDPRHTLAGAVLLVLLVDPLASLSLGFQLSVLATLGLLVIAPRISARMGGGPIAATAALTLGATLAVTPLLVLIVGRLSVVAIPANLVVAPMAGPVTLIGAAAATLAMVWRPLGAIAVAATLPLWAMRALARAFAALPAAEVRIPMWAAIGVSAASLVMATRAGTRSVRIPAFVTGCLLAASTLAAGPAPRGLVVTMLDVGQGEAIVVRAESRTMLIDGGGDPALLRRRLAETGIARIDLLVLSHPHADHLDGLTGAVGSMPIGRALDPMIDAGDAALPSYGRVVAALGAARVPIDRAIAGNVIELGPARLEILWPPREHLVGTDSDVNNNSVVLRAVFGDDVVLFSGETQEEAQQALLADPGALRASVLKVSHHGSKRMLPAFYRASGASIALIPVGQNRYGHPAAETLAAIQGMRVLRSDLHGTVTLGLDGRGGAAVRTTKG